MNYNEARKTFEKHWQSVWEKKKLYQAKTGGKKPKFYGLIEFPYPSGAGMHVGHVRSQTAMDIITRKRRMEGFNVLYPIGWDAFGLPTENYAIKMGIDPAVATKQNTDNFRRQLKAMGFGFDWEREIDTTDPEYYKWTQWMFLKFFEKGLAYKAKTYINWCPKDKIGLANEEAAGGVCDRCGGPVEKREKEQWMIAITKYADKLLKGLEGLDYIPQAVTQQTNWIGRSEGVEIDFKIATKKITKCVMIHGCPPNKESFINVETDSDKHWISWMRRKLTTEGIQVYNPVMPNAWRPNYEEWKAEIEKLNIDAQTVLIGHSCGGAFLVRWLSESKKNIAKLVLVAAAKIPADDATPEKRLWSDFIIDKNIKEYCDEVVVFIGEQDKERHQKSARLYAAELGGRLIQFPNYGHFMPADMGGTNAFPELLQEVVPSLKVFTTRPDTLFGATYMVLAPEHKLISDLRPLISNFGEVQKYIASVKNKPEEERLAFEKDPSAGSGQGKTGVELKGIKAINPATKQEIPVWVADYVLSTYGTGAIMAVPQHDERDRAFAEKFKLPIVNKPLISIDEAIKITGGKKTVKYKLRDWVFSRQRYWGEPIPLIKCETDGWVAVPEKDLPVKLPKVEKYQPTDTGESPLSAIESFVNVKCPKCKKPAKRETDTMPNWAGSSWYFLRYLDPKNKKEFASKKALEYFMPVDWYNGGMEHTVLHLLYSRFWNMFLRDLGLVPTSEPYQKRTSHGMVLAADGSKMSKSLGNVINPDDIIAEFGADALRMYEMFMGPFNQAISWDPHGILGCTRFLERVYRIGIEKVVKKGENPDLEKSLHKTIKKVSEDIESMSFNTAISSMMVFVNEAASKESMPSDIWKAFLQILAPFAPHLTEELWQKLTANSLKLKASPSIHVSEWPAYDAKLIVEDAFELIIQVNGKVRDKVSAPMGISQADAEKLATGREETKKWLSATPKKVIFVSNRLINFII